MSDPLVLRYQQYFRHPDYDHEVLEIGDRANACSNVRRALGMLHVSVGGAQADELLFDDGLKEGVFKLQGEFSHRVADGRVGPGTRELIVSELMHKFSSSIFARFRRPEIWSRPSVFVSYASADRDAVNKLDQWLRDHRVRVVRDCQFFVAGTTIQENIVRALAHSDKILAVLSKNSRDRDWPRLERQLAEQVEAKMGTPVLIYLCLDDVLLPAHDSTRLAIVAKGKTLKQVGDEILHAVTGVEIPQWEYAYDENAPL